jgi:dihydrofolate reductase
VARAIVLYGSNVTTTATGLSGAADTDEPFTFVTDGLPGAIVQAKAFAGDREVSLTAGNLAGQVLATALVDAVSVSLVPLVFGTGARFFGDYAASPLILDDPRWCKATG